MVRTSLRRVAQLVRAPASHAGGLRFEPWRAYHTLLAKSSLRRVFRPKSVRTLAAAFNQCEITPPLKRPPLTIAPLLGATVTVMAYGWLAVS
jgi:hypothetical protein